MYIAFNELSGRINSDKTNDPHQAKKIIISLVLFLKELKKQDAVEGIMFEKQDDILSSEILKGYTIYDWLKDKSVDKEYKRFLLSYISKSTFTYDKNEVCGEFKVNINNEDHVGVGCTYAHEHDGYTLSICSHITWKQHIISGQYFEIDKNGELIIGQKEVSNLCDEASIHHFERLLQEKTYSNISSGYDLWEQRSKLFPNLVFCDDVKEQLYKDPEKFHIESIMRKLQGLQEYFAKCGDIYDPKELGMNARTESDTVKSDPELKKYRLFRLPNGEEKYFYDHIGFSGKFKGGRIYFLPCPSKKFCYIGYIGRHLPTDKF